MLRLPLPHHGLSPDLRLHWRISTSVRSANLLANLRIVTDEQLEKCITSGRHQPTLGAQRRLDGVNWSSRYRHVGTCVMRQPVRPSAVAPHKTGPRLRVRPSAKVVGATRRVSIMREVVVHQHAAHRHAMRHRTVIEVDDIPAHGGTALTGECHPSRFERALRRALPAKEIGRAAATAAPEANGQSNT